MHEHVLQSIGTRQPLSQQQHHSFFLDELYPKKNSAIVQPIQTQAQTPQKDNSKKPSCFSPVLPGTGNLTHNVTRMLFESTPEGKHQTSDLLRSTYHTFDYSGCYSKGNDLNKRTSFDSPPKQDDETIDVEGDSQDHLRTSDLPNTTDSSISTQGSSSPSSSESVESPKSSINSPGSGSEPATSPDVKESEPPKKKARTNYTPDQIQTLLKIFHENPYPDSEMMETIGKDLGVPENKIKIWFQNKRARWRRRVNDNMNNYVQPFVPMSPMLSPVGPYGFMTPNPMNPMTPVNPMMRTSPPHGMPGYFNMPWMQGPSSPNGNQVLSANMTRYPQTTQHTPMSSQQISPSAFPVSSAASHLPTRTSPQQMLTSQNGRQFQYPQYLSASSYPSAQNLH